MVPVVYVRLETVFKENDKSSMRPYITRSVAYGTCVFCCRRQKPFKISDESVIM